MKNKTSLHLTPAYYPHLGGVENHVAKVCQELSRRGNCCKILTLRLEPDWPLQEKYKNSSIYRLNVGSDPGPFASWLTRSWYKLRVWWQMLQHLKVLREADVIQIHDVWWWVWPFSWFLPKSKLFMTFHGYEGSQNPDDRQRRAHQSAAKMTRGNLCIGGFHEKWYGVKPTLVSFGAVEVGGQIDKKVIGSSEIPDRVRNDDKWVQDDSHCNLIYAGRLDADVGIMEYLQGLKECTEKSPTRQLKLDVFGSGPLLNQAKIYSKRNHLPVKFHRWVEPRLIDWSKYDIALVSRHLAIIEALAHGLPVVAHYSSPIKNDYLLLSPFAKWIQVFDNPSRFGEIIENLNPLSAEAKKWARRQTWGKMVDLYEGMWRK